MNHGTVLRNSIKLLIKKLGQDLTLRTVAEGSYDPSTGTTGASTTTDRVVKMALVDYNTDEIDGSQVRFGDRRALISNYDSDGQLLTLPPLVNDLIIGEGDNIAIVRVKKFRVYNEDVAWLAQVRE